MDVSKDFNNEIVFIEFEYLTSYAAIAPPTGRFGIFTFATGDTAVGLI